LKIGDKGEKRIIKTERIKMTPEEMRDKAVDLFKKRFH
jgi:hypothetical protein